MLQLEPNRVAFGRTGWPFLLPSFYLVSCFLYTNPYAKEKPKTKETTKKQTKKKTPD